MGLFVVGKHRASASNSKMEFVQSTSLGASVLAVMGCSWACVSMTLHIMRPGNRNKRRGSGERALCLVTRHANCMCGLSPGFHTQTILQQKGVPLPRTWIEDLWVFNTCTVPLARKLRLLYWHCPLTRIFAPSSTEGKGIHIPED